jgi:hypothetical protein
MKAVTESTLAAPATRRDVLAGLLHDIITSPNAGTRSHTQACATIAQAFAWLDGSDDRLAAQHRARRERALLIGLAQALRIVERHDLTESLRIVDEIAEVVAPMPGEPLDLNIETLCAFGSRCVHRGGA